MSSKPEIIEEVEMPMFEVKEEINKIKKKIEEPNFRVQKTEEYINTFSFLNQKQSKELVKKLRDLEIPRLGDKHIYKILDILPKSLEELKVVMQGYPLTINNDNLKKILKTILEVAPEKAEKSK